MDDSISRQAAIEAVQQHREDVLGSYKYDEGVAFVYAAAHNHIIRVIKQLPSAERRGRWIKNEFGAYCSECGLYAYLSNGIPWESNYCPICGSFNGKDDLNEKL